MNKFEIHTNYECERNPAMLTILKLDEKAKFKTKTRWTFKVKTNLTLDEINTNFLAEDYMYTVKKTWFF
jgi:hypothetical protein